MAANQIPSIRQTDPSLQGTTATQGPDYTRVPGYAPAYPPY
jgi:hypothetical protein